MKSDIGDAMLYTSPAVHAVTAVTDGGITDNLVYDDNGNLDNGDDVPTIVWSSYNKPVQLTKGSNTYTFAYGPDRKRYKKVHNGDLTHYIGTHYEKVTAGFVWGERHYIRAYGRVVAQRLTLLGTPIPQYLHRDHLGSVTTITDINGNVSERFSYDAWGIRRSAVDWTLTAPATNQIRGYTGHEHLDDIGVIHMNGRIYSPELGRMLSPDPLTQAPDAGQNYNRYSYANNNPLRYNDLSGFACFIAAAGYDAYGNFISSRSCFDDSRSGYFGVSNRGIPDMGPSYRQAFRSFGLHYQRLVHQVGRTVRERLGDRLGPDGAAASLNYPLSIHQIAQLHGADSLAELLINNGGNVMYTADQIVLTQMLATQPGFRHGLSQYIEDQSIFAGHLLDLGG